MKQWRGMQRMLGPFGMAGVGVLLLCAIFYIGVIRPAEIEIAAQRDAAARLKSRSPYQSVALDKRGDDLRRFYNLFPTTDKIPGTVERLWRIAAAGKIDLQRGEYRLEAAGPGLARYRVTLPLRTSYGQIRSFINAVLQETPTAAIEGLRFERKIISETLLDAQIDLTFYFRTMAPAQP